MNGLSWLIYLADMSGTAKAVSMMVIAGCAAVSIVGFILGLSARDNLSWSHLRDKADWDALARERMKLWRHVLPYAIGAAIVLVVFPSTQTIYAIAASEMGEEVIKSPTAGKAVKALDAWLDQQIVKNGGAQ